jgi:hypothetical protein
VITGGVEALPGRGAAQGGDLTDHKNLEYSESPQDIPYAVQLLQTIIQLCNLKIQVPITPTIIADMDAFLLLAELLKGILGPFTDVKMSLPCQIEFLTKYAHLSFVIL